MGHTVLEVWPVTGILVLKILIPRTKIFNGKSVPKTNFFRGKWSASGEMVQVLVVYILVHERQSGCAGVSHNTYKR